MKKAWLPLLLMIISLAGLLWSRAVLSLSSVLWLAWVISQYKRGLFTKTNTPLLVWGLSPAVLALLGSWQYPFATEDLDYLLTVSIYFLAACSSIMIGLQNATLSLLKTWVVTAIISLVYPLSWYFIHYEEALVRYGTGRTVPVFMDNDHVRYGIFLSIAAFLGICFFYQNKIFRIISICLIPAIVLLAIRTAWVTTAVMFMAGLFFICFHGSYVQKRNTTIAALIALIVFFFAFQYVPGIQQKIAYMVYDWQQYRSGKINPSLSDGTRMVMNGESWKLIQAGRSDMGWFAIDDTLRQQVIQAYPGKNFDFGWPFNQWLFWWMGSGITGMLLFSCWLMYPVIEGFRKKNVGLICVSAGIIVSCLVEANLAYQYSVWMHAWCIALVWNQSFSLGNGKITSESGSS